MWFFFYNKGKKKIEKSEEKILLGPVWWYSYTLLHHGFLCVLHLLKVFPLQIMLHLHHKWVIPNLQLKLFFLYTNQSLSVKFKLSAAFLLAGDICQAVVIASGCSVLFSPRQCLMSLIDRSFLGIFHCLGSSRQFLRGFRTDFLCLTANAV